MWQLKDLGSQGEGETSRVGRRGRRRKWERAREGDEPGGESARAGCSELGAAHPHHLAPPPLSAASPPSLPLFSFTYQQLC